MANLFTKELSVYEYSPRSWVVRTTIDNPRFFTEYKDIINYVHKNAVALTLPLETMLLITKLYKEQCDVDST